MLHSYTYGPKYRSVFSIVKCVFVVTENIDICYVYTSIINRRNRNINVFTFEGMNVFMHTKFYTI